MLDLINMVKIPFKTTREAIDYMRWIIGLIGLFLIALLCFRRSQRSGNSPDHHTSSNKEDQKKSEEQYTEREIYEGYSEEALEMILEQESRVLERYITVINDVDDKAADTLRLNILILSLILALASFSVGPENEVIEGIMNYALYTGVGLSFLSITSSLIGYTRTNIASGLSSESIDDLLSTPRNKKPVLFSLVKAHKEWIVHNHHVNRIDSLTVFGAHVFLFAALGCYGLAVLWATNPRTQVVLHPILQISIVLLLACLFLPGLYFLINRNQ